jgi:putative ABC transport system permease protein
MGASDFMLLRMILLQAAMVGAIGYGLGVGFATCMGFLSGHTELSFRLPWQLLCISAVAVMMICAISAVVSMWRVVRLEPAIVFKG